MPYKQDYADFDTQQEAQSHLDRICGRKDHADIFSLGIRDIQVRKPDGELVTKFRARWEKYT